MGNTASTYDDIGFAIGLDCAIARATVLRLDEAKPIPGHLYLVPAGSSRASMPTLVFIYSVDGRSAAETFTTPFMTHGSALFAITPMLCVLCRYAKFEFAQTTPAGENTAREFFDKAAEIGSRVVTIK